MNYLLNSVAPSQTGQAIQVLTTALGEDADKFKDDLQKEGSQGFIMEEYGQGYCRSGYLRGWDRKGLDSQAACNAVCLAEAACTYAAWNNGRTCSRYKEASCELNTATDYYTYKKTASTSFTEKLQAVTMVSAPALREDPIAADPIDEGMGGGMIALIVILVLLCMAGVAGGVYYYISQPSKGKMADADGNKETSIEATEVVNQSGEGKHTDSDPSQWRSKLKHTDSEKADKATSGGKQNKPKSFPPGLQGRWNSDE